MVQEVAPLLHFLGKFQLTLNFLTPSNLLASNLTRLSGDRKSKLPGKRRRGGRTAGSDATSAVKTNALVMKRPHGCVVCFTVLTHTSPS